MRFPIEWLREWRILDNFCCVWDDAVHTLFAPASKKPPRTRLQLETLEDRLAPSTSPLGTAFVALKYQSFNGIVGAFTPETGLSNTDYQAKILWGDGSQSSGSIDSSCNVSGTHTFNASGVFAVAF